MIGYVYCTVEFPAFHYYPSAPEEVSFLRERHRHLFKIKCFAPIEHSNRDVEFISLKTKIQNFCSAKFANVFLGMISCEDIGNILLNHFDMLSHIEVSEDGENGCIVYKRHECKCEDGCCNG